DPVLAPAAPARRGGGAPAGPRRADVPGRDDAHPQPPPPDRRRLGRRPPRRGPPRKAGPSDRRRRGQAARGTPGVGAGPGAPAVTPAEGDVVRPHGSPPRTDPAGRLGVIFFV